MDAHGENLIRILSATAPAWSNGDLLGSECWFAKERHPIRKVATATFTGETGDPVSVFVARDHLVEAEIVAARNLTRSGSPKKPALVLRIPSIILLEVGVRVEVTVGDTGVGSVDQLHRDLHGDAFAFERLTKALLVEKRNGLDIVRSIAPATLCKLHESFSTRPGPELTSKARENAKGLADRYRQFQRPG